MGRQGSLGFFPQPAYPRPFHTRSPSWRLPRFLSRSLSFSIHSFAASRLHVCAFSIRRFSPSSFSFRPRHIPSLFAGTFSPDSSLQYPSLSLTLALRRRVFARSRIRYSDSSRFSRSPVLAHDSDFPARSRVRFARRRREVGCICEKATAARGEMVEFGSKRGRGRTVEKREKKRRGDCTR